jgi:hypothetical protein
MTQILTPIYAIAKVADLDEINALIDKYPDKDPKSFKGRFEQTFIRYYEETLKFAKREIEEQTPEYIIKKAVPAIARELWGLVPESDKEYTKYDNFKYKEDVKYNKEEGWFEINAMHFKCYVEQHMPGETAFTRIVPKWIKTCFDLKEDDIRRRTITIDDEDLSKEFKGTKKPKVNCYKFYFKDFIDTSTFEKINLKNQPSDMGDINQTKSGSRGIF